MKKVTGGGGDKGYSPGPDPIEKKGKTSGREVSHEKKQGGLSKLFGNLKMESKSEEVIEKPTRFVERSSSEPSKGKDLINSENILKEKKDKLNEFRSSKSKENYRSGEYNTDEKVEEKLTRDVVYRAQQLEKRLKDEIRTVENSPEKAKLLPQLKDELKELEMLIENSQKENEKLSNVIEKGEKEIEKSKKEKVEEKPRELGPDEMVTKEQQDFNEKLAQYRKRHYKK